MKTHQTKEELLIRIKTSWPYIYKLKGGYYFLSASICRGCTGGEHELCDKINEILDKLPFYNGEVDKSQIKESEISEIAKMYSQLRELDSRYDEENHKQAKRDINSLFESLSKEEIESVAMQLEDLSLVKWCSATEKENRRKISENIW